MSEEKHEDSQADGRKRAAAAEPDAGDSGSQAKSEGKSQDKADTSGGAGKKSRLSPEADAAAARAREKSKRSSAQKSAPAKQPERSAGTAGAGGSGNAGTSGNAAAKRSGGGGGWILGLLALLIAVVSIVVSGWLWYRGEQRLASVDSRLNTVEQGLQSNVQDVVMPRLSKLDERLQSLADTSKQRSETLSSLQQELRSTQTRNARLAERLDGNGNRWALRQIESLLQAANQRLQLYNDPEAAKQALELASDAISDMGDPRLFEVRKQVVNEIAALDALPDPDIEGLSLKLNAMLEQVPDLPLASDVPTEYQQDESGNNGAADADSELDFSRGWQHFVDSVGQALSSMVTIRHDDGTQNALMPPDQVFFLTQNLQLELRSARLSLLERKTENYRESLASAREYLKQHYATGNSQVSSMLEQLKQMSNVKLDWQAPDISSSLGTLRDRLAQRSDNNGSTSENNSGDQSSQAGNNAGEDAR